MGKVLTRDLLNQYERAIAMVRFTIEEFDDEQWLSGISWFQTPARLGYHVIEALDFYFSGKRDGTEFQYGHRFGGPWWELKDEELPGQDAVLEYLSEMETKIAETFESLADEDLLAPFTLYDWSGKTVMGHHVYALRHTMHHQGALTVLATHHGHENKNWR